MAFLLQPTVVAAAEYAVGPGQSYATPSDVPWEALQAGDTVLIYWRATPYRDKWVMTAQGTADFPVIVRGVPSADGQLPVIDGAGAVTRLALNYWNEDRGVIKIGGSNVPGDTMPRYITIENLEVRGARPGNTFVDEAGEALEYSPNAAAIYVERGEHITVRNTRLHDSGNGLFIASPGSTPSRDIVVEGNHIYDNGNVNSEYEHNVYSEAVNVTFQFNRLGGLKAGAEGNNLKDRSAGLTVRYNWVEDGNRQLDLVDSGNDAIRGDAAYRTTFVYGNVLVEGAEQGNPEVVHFGGDSGNEANYRSGTLHFYNNTVVSYRTDQTTILRLSTNSQHADVRNNIFFVTAAADTLSLVGAYGVLDLSANWLNAGYVTSFSAFTGTLVDAGSSVLGTTPEFRDIATQDFHLAAASTAQDSGQALSDAIPAEHALQFQYVKDLSGEMRPSDAAVDIGAYEVANSVPPAPAALVINTAALTAGSLGTPYAAVLAASGGVAPYHWSISSGALPAGVTLTSISGAITGTPSQSGEFSLVVAVADSQRPAVVARQSLTLSVVGTRLGILTTKLANARRNKRYSQTLTATGGLRPYGWTVTSGTLPAGLVLDGASGVISGRPTTVGSSTFTIQLRDGQVPSQSTSRSFSLRVAR
jgi:hypothetical protein